LFIEAIRTFVPPGHFLEERIMVPWDLEREKGITIRAKNAAFKYHDFHINIVGYPRTRDSAARSSAS